MENYKHILLAVDLHPDCDELVIEKAAALAKQYGAKLTIIHAVEHISAYGVAQAYPTVVDIEQQLADEAKTKLVEMQQKYQIPEAEIIVEVGASKMVILDKAKALAADLIVLGSHGRHGLQILLGSTANAVLHHAECDVLAVRIT